MKIIFHIEYYAGDDERLHLILGGVEHPMRREADGKWSFEADMAVDPAPLVYRYELRAADGALLRGEWGGPHRLDAAGAGRVEIFDCWSDMPAVAPLYSSFFTQGVFRRHDRQRPAAVSDDSLLLRVEAPGVAPDETVGVVGSDPALGEWHADRAVVMSDGDAPVWSVALPRSVMGSEYKFVILDAATLVPKCYEEGFNRRFPDASGDGAVVADGLRLRDGRPLWRGAGVAVPVFSLRSRSGWGCGEFRDLHLMADWAADADLSVIQLLPVNDTSSTGGWRDSYPYNALSSLALHPIYISAEAVVDTCAGYAGVTALKAEFVRFAGEGTHLNRLPAVDYEAVMNLKMRFLRRAYDLCGDDVLSSDACRTFEEENAEWLFPYTVFSALRDGFGTSDFRRWDDMSHYDDARMRAYAREHSRAVRFYAFVQYMLDSQLREARAYARARGVLLKGDIPIGVSPTSVEVWRSPELFNLAMSAGAPPDDFAADGQNWGFPTYDWTRMAADGYAWWRSRLRKMSEYFDAYRIDHILGFFRIWEVPRAAASALLGHFNPSRPYTAAEIVSFGFPFDAARHTAGGRTPADVLFLEDPYTPEHYFPRIEGCRTEAFASLDPEAREAYKRLYDDFYYCRHNDFWRDCAMRRLPALMAATGMLACGEDLGMIPACVPDVMRARQILSLEIERMPKQFGVQFGDTAQYPYLSVASTSTHDTSTLRGWWREDRDATQRYWSEVMHRDGAAPADCTGEAAGEIIGRHMRSASILAILPLQDWMAVDETLRAADPESERINIPADPDHYWRYRMHITLEELIAARDFGSTVRRLVELRRK